jgi:hypothetical protein
MFGHGSTPRPNDRWDVGFYSQNTRSVDDLSAGLRSLRERALCLQRHAGRGGDGAEGQPPVLPDAKGHRSEGQIGDRRADSGGAAQFGRPGALGRRWPRPRTRRRRRPRSGQVPSRPAARRCADAERYPVRRCGWRRRPNRAWDRPGSCRWRAPSSPGAFPRREARPPPAPGTSLADGWRRRSTGRPASATRQGRPRCAGSLPASGRPPSPPAGSRSWRGSARRRPGGSSPPRCRAPWPARARVRRPCATPPTPRRAPGRPGRNRPGRRCEWPGQDGSDRRSPRE